MKKKILFIYNKIRATKKTNRIIHCGWITDCQNCYEVEFWGKGFSETSIDSLQKKIDSFKPDYIYGTNRKASEQWLPDISKINVEKVFVETDTWGRPSTDQWYNQFDSLYCRASWWGKSSQKYHKGLGSRKKFLKHLENCDTWKNIKLFKWSVPENLLDKKTKRKRKGVFFVGRATLPSYKHRIKMYKRFKKRIKFEPGINVLRMYEKKKYWSIMMSASALVCPTESVYGDYVPSKIFEYAASGAAVLTNCDLVRYGMKDLDEFVINYKNWDDLEDKLDMNFKPYHNIARDVLRNHTHIKRYKELFG